MEEIVTLLVEDTPLECKKHLLIESSDYFRAMFEGNFIERDKSTITLKEIDLHAMKIVLDHMANQSHISDEDLLSALHVACVLQFNAIRERCISAITNKLTAANSIKVWAISDALGITPLNLKAKNLALLEFNTIRTTEALFELNLRECHAYLSHVALNCKQELDVFLAAMQWYYENGEGRPEVILELMSCVDFKSATVDEIREMQMLPDISRNPKLADIFACIIGLKNNQTTETGIKDFTKVAEKLLNSRKRRSLPMPVFLTVKYEPPGNLIEAFRDANKRQRRYLRLASDKTSTPSLTTYNIYERRFAHTIDGISGKLAGCEGYTIRGYKDQIFVYGGEVVLGSSQWNMFFWMYDTICEKWEHRTQLPNARRHFLSCVCGPYVFIIGGIGLYRIIQEDMYWYNYKENIWSTSLILPCATRELQCCNHNGQLLLLCLNNLIIKCYLFSMQQQKFVVLNVVDEHQHLHEIYPQQYTYFSYENRIYVKGARQLIEFELRPDCLAVVKATKIQGEMLRPSYCFDSAESIVCDGNVITLYKSSDEQTAYADIMPLSTCRLETLPSDEEYPLNKYSRLFALHHYSTIAKNEYVNDLPTCDEIKSIFNTK